MSAPIPEVFASMVWLPADAPPDLKRAVAEELYSAPIRVTFGADE